MIKQYFYIGKKEALKHQSLVYAVSETQVENYKEAFGDNALEFYGDNLPYYLTVLENDEVREATEIELYKSGLYELKEEEFIKDDVIYSINDFPIPEGIIKPVFDFENLEWLETATEEEISQYIFNNSIEFYNSELKVANKATTEYMCEIITEEEYSEVKEYLRKIEPYNSKTLSEVEMPERPKIFARYEGVK